VIAVAAICYENTKGFRCDPCVFDCPDWYDCERSEVFGFKLLGSQNGLSSAGSGSLISGTAYDSMRCCSMPWR